MLYQKTRLISSQIVEITHNCVNDFSGPDLGKFRSPRDRCERCYYMKCNICAFISPKLNGAENPQTFHVPRPYYVVYNAAKILGPGLKPVAAGRSKCSQKRPKFLNVSPDKCMMPLSYDLEIFTEYLPLNVRYSPKYGPRKSHSNRDIGPRKT